MGTFRIYIFASNRLCTKHIPHKIIILYHHRTCIWQATSAHDNVQTHLCPFIFSAPFPSLPTATTPRPLFPTPLHLYNLPFPTDSNAPFHPHQHLSQFPPRHLNSSLPLLRLSLLHRRQSWCTPMGRCAGVEVVVR